MDLRPALWFFVFLACMMALSRCDADELWAYEFEFGYMLPASDRLFAADCRKVVPVQFVAWYAVDPRPGWEVSCGNQQPVFTHFLGRRCFKPLPKLVFDCGWRHFSSPNDREELSFDTLGIRGRFSW